MRTCRATAWDLPWFATRWTCTGDGLRSTGHRWAVRDSRYGSLDAELRRDLELDSLRERQLAAPVDRVGLAAHVCLPGIRAGFAAATGVLLAPEGAADLGPGGTEIDVGDTAITAGSGQEGFRVLQAIGEQRRGQAVRRGVLCRDRIRERGHRDHVQDGREGL